MFHDSNQNQNSQITFVKLNFVEEGRVDTNYKIINWFRLTILHPS